MARAYSGGSEEDAGSERQQDSAEVHRSVGVRERRIGSERSVGQGMKEGDERFLLLSIDDMFSEYQSVLGELLSHRNSKRNLPFHNFSIAGASLVTFSLIVPWFDILYYKT